MSLRVSEEIKAGVGLPRAGRLATEVCSIGTDDCLVIIIGFPNTQLLYEMSCPDCFSGTLHTGTPTGTVTTLHGLPTYVAEPEAGKKPKGIIVFIPDVFGWEFPNNRLLADAYAKKGDFLVYLPDFMAGNSLHKSTIDTVDELKKPQSWLKTIFYKPVWFFQVLFRAIPFFITNREANFKPRVFNFISALRTNPPPFPTNNLKIGAAGFCWGGYYTVLLCQNAPSSRIARHSSQTSSEGIQPLIDCGYTAHPSMLTIPKDLEPIELPICVSIGEEDMQMTAPNVLIMKEVLEVKKKGDHEVNIIPGATHGFAVRLDPKDKHQVECAEKAEVQAIEWFTKHFT
ncbi:hypothetical protein G7Y89_g1671 [Cudoniella acicularis]|uniref:Dienelactone hydrolase domain-containing protein n=1 Tax=Cudoniella acicularis TaxID=354080 RepID=A0A8H4RWL4_9HELO|nr:hypothetical protein G7Y89_g1671 [Cudoniella acicularis]